MAESIYIPDTQQRSEIYEALQPQVATLLADEPDLIANLANFVAVLKEAFQFFWVGFYIVKDNQLVLGPFQGSLACTRIAFDKGVCGASYTQQKTLIVPDVDAFPGHIACSSASRSEIVVPVFDKDKNVVMVLDVDSTELNDFSEKDQKGLENLVRLIERNVL